MCHPGYVDADLRRTPTRLLAERERELDALTRPGLRRVLAEQGVELITYRELSHENGGANAKRTNDKEA